jgi:hypothetical protein
MKKLLLLPMLGALVVSCNQAQESAPAAAPSVRVLSTTTAGGRLTGRLNVSNLVKMPRVGLASKMKVSLLTPGGVAVSQTSAVKPNTTYRLVVEGNEDAQVRACFGFDLISKSIDEGQSTATNYVIKTHPDVLEPLIVSVVPLRRVGASVYREQAQTITLTH